MMDFPRHVYKNRGSIERAGGTYSHLLTKSTEEHAAALAAGWSATLPEAIEPPKTIPVPPALPKEEHTAALEEIPVTAPEAHELDADAPPTRAELEAKARELGIEFSPKIGDKKLSDRIDAALKALEA